MYPINRIRKIYSELKDFITPETSNFEVVSPTFINGIENLIDRNQTLGLHVISLSFDRLFPLFFEFTK